MCLYSWPWLAVFAIADGAFALAVLIISLIMKGPIWTSSVTGQLWFVAAAVLGAVLYLASVVVIVKFWNEDQGIFVGCGVLLRLVAQLILGSVIVIPFKLALFLKEEDKCVDFCSSSGPTPDLIYAVIGCLFLGTHWPTFHAFVHAFEQEKGFRPTCWQWIICCFCYFWRYQMPVAPAPAPPPSTHPSAHPSAHLADVIANAHLAPVSPSSDVESASATRDN